MRKQILLILLTGIILLLTASLYAQSGSRYALEAMEYFQRGEYRNAIEQYKLADRAADGQVPAYRFWLGRLYIAENDTLNARLWLNRYLDSGEERNRTEVQNYLRILDRQTKIFDSFEISRLPRYIFSWNSDYGAIMSPDNNYLYFTSLRPSSYEKENIWRAERFSSGWGRPELMPNLNTDKNEAVGSFSMDGNTAYLFGNFERNKIDGDIYISTFNGSRWSNPVNLTAVNSDQIDLHPMVFQDKWMFFTSSREGGFGGTDIWVSEFADGAWSLPQNLGPMINTAQNEQTPFLDFDGITLVFASDGHPGFGGYDLFKAVKIGSGWQEWSIPENLGIPANSIRDDRFFFHAKDTNQGFISTDRQASGYEKFIATNFVFTTPPSYLVRDPETGDVISIDVGDEPPAEIEEPLLSIVTGRVLDEDGNPVLTQIVFEAIIDGQRYRQVANTDANGNYTLDLPAGKTYDVVVNEEGYMIFTQTYTPQAGSDNLNITLQKLREERIFVLENIQFEFNSSQLTEASKVILNNSVITLLNNPDIKVELSGHTCNMGSAEYNLWLSERRAQSVRNYLISKGLEASRLTAVGFGLTRPIESNDSLAGRIKNRRVEFKVLDTNN